MAIVLKKHWESYGHYVGRMEAALELYLQSRKVETWDKLKASLVADEVKDELPKHVKSYIYLKKADAWFSVADLAKEVENYMITITPKSQSTLPCANKFSSRLEYKRYAEHSENQPTKNETVDVNNIEKFGKERFATKEKEQPNHPGVLV